MRQLRNTDDEEPNNFRWAVTTLSKAKNYDEIVDAIKTEKDSFTKYKDTAESYIERTKTTAKDIKELKRDQQKISDELLEIGKKFSDEGQKDLINKRQNHVKAIEKKQEEIAKYQRELSDFTRKLNNIDSEINKKINELKEYEHKLHNLELFDKKIENLEDGQLKRAKEAANSSLNKKMEELKENRAKVDGVYNLYSVALSNLKDKNEVECPLCDEGHLDYKKLNKKIEVLKQEKEAISSEIVKINQNIRSLDNEYNETIKKRSEYNKIIDNLKTDVRNANSIKDSLQDHMDQQNFQINKVDKEKITEEKELEKIRQLIGKDDEETDRELTKNENKKKELADQIAVKTDEINKYTLTIGGTDYKPDEILGTIQSYLNVLEHLIDYSKKMADKQRQAAADRFNDAIKNLIVELDFKEFRGITLNTDFRLYVERQDPKTKEYVSQLVSTLSTSEKLAIALILQIAIKETYLRHIPFLVLDDVMEDFDEDRRNSIYKYLLNKAKEQDWVIISTKLKEEKVPIHVVSWNAA